MQDLWCTINWSNREVPTRRDFRRSCLLQEFLCNWRKVEWDAKHSTPTYAETSSMYVSNKIYMSAYRKGWYSILYLISPGWGCCQSNGGKFSSLHWNWPFLTSVKKSQKNAENSHKLYLVERGWGGCQSDGGKSSGFHWNWPFWHPKPIGFFLLGHIDNFLIKLGSF